MRRGSYGSGKGGGFRRHGRRLHPPVERGREHLLLGPDRPTNLRRAVREPRSTSGSGHGWSGSRAGWRSVGVSASRPAGRMGGLPHPAVPREPGFRRERLWLPSHRAHPPGAPMRLALTARSPGRATSVAPRARARGDADHRWWLPVDHAPGPSSPRSRAGQPRPASLAGPSNPGRGTSRSRSNVAPGPTSVGALTSE